MSSAYLAGARLVGANFFTDFSDAVTQATTPAPLPAPALPSRPRTVIPLAQLQAVAKQQAAIDAVARARAVAAAKAKLGTRSAPLSTPGTFATPPGQTTLDDVFSTPPSYSDEMPAEDLPSELAPSESKLDKLRAFAKSKAGLITFGGAFLAIGGTSIYLATRKG